MATGLDPARYVPLVVLPEEGELAGDLRAAGVEVLVRRLAVMRRALATPRGLAALGARWAADAGRLGRLARRRDVALVHSTTSVTLGGAPAARIARVPHVWHVREIYADFPEAFTRHRRLLEGAAALPCVSAATRAQFGPGDRAFVLHDGLAVEPRGAPRAQARAQLGLPADAFVVAVVGRIAAWKGQSILVQALTQLPEPSVALIAGAPWPGDEMRLVELRALAAQLGVGDRVVFPGVLEDPGVAFGAADVVAVPSTLPDPFPNAALEAAAAGCCVVASNHGGAPEMLSHNVTGVLVAPDDPYALATALGALSRDPERRGRIGEQAARTIPVHFSRAALLDKIQALYDRLLD
jgi:glycosyltransferase involved in cell wall biosynthesis